MFKDEKRMKSIVLAILLMVFSTKTLAEDYVVPRGRFDGFVELALALGVIATSIILFWLVSRKIKSDRDSQ